MPKNMLAAANSDRHEHDLGLSGGLRRAGPALDGRRGSGSARPAAARTRRAARHSAASRLVGLLRAARDRSEAAGRPRRRGRCRGRERPARIHIVAITRR